MVGWTTLHCQPANKLLELLQVYLPHGAYVKVSTSGQLINVWIVPSPTDLYMTEGELTAFYILCDMTAVNHT